jgi:AraC family transcriptional regulator
MTTISAITPGAVPSAASAFDINVTAVETVLHRSALVALGEYRCAVNHPQFSGGGPQRCPFIVFPRSSVRIHRVGGKPLLYTPNSISLYNVGDIYCRDKVSPEGDRSDWIAVEASLLREVSARHGLRVDDGERIFETSITRSTPAIYAAQRALFGALRAQPHAAALGVEEQVIDLVDRICAEIALGGDTENTCPHAVTTRFLGRSADIVEATLKLLATDFCSTLGVTDIGARVHCSPGYLSRLFRRHTGFTLHEYQQQLRLRAALEMLLDSNAGLAEIAMRLGFANHSHFSSAFRRQFAITPRDFQRNASGKRFKTMRESVALLRRTDSHRSSYSMPNYIRADQG